MVLVVGRRASGGQGRDDEDARDRAMAEALRAGGFVARNVAVGDMNQLIDALDRDMPDLAFCSFFRFSNREVEDPYLRNACVASGVAWIGSPPDAMELALSKPRMKRQWRICGIPTPDWFAVSKAPDGSLEGLEMVESARDFPYIVKPASEGNSRGIDDGSVARKPLELISRVSLVAEEFGEAIVERYVAGGTDSREFTVAMIGNRADAIVSPVEIRRTSADSLVISEDDKEGRATRAAPIDDEGLRAKVTRLARKAFLSSGVRDYARCDILLHEGKLYAIELNAQPLVPDPWFAACAREAGLGDAQYPNAIALAGIVGNIQTGHAFVSIPRELSRLLPRDAYDLLAKPGDSP
jgi:D-alanine-D-alanine ligase